MSFLTLISDNYGVIRTTVGANKFDYVNRPISLNYTSSA